MSTLRSPLRPRLLPIGRIDRYILRQIGFGLVAVTGGLTVFIWLTQSLRFIGLIIDRGLSLGVFLRLTGLLIPSFVAVVLPITIFVVVQFVYQRLATDRELTVMRAVGLSPWRLARPALLLAVVVCGLEYGLTIWVVPASIGAFRQFQFEIRNRLAAVLLQEGVFTPITKGVTLYIRSRRPDGTLHGILLEDERQPRAATTILAESGRLIAGPDGPRVVLENGSRQQIDRRTGRLNVLTFKENTLDLGESSATQAQRFRDASEVGLAALLHPDPALVAARDIPSWKAEAHRRLAEPLTAISYTLIALVSVLTGGFRRQGSLLRPFVAVLVMVGMVALWLAANNLAARQSALLPLIWIAAIGPGLVAGWLLLGPRILPAGFGFRLFSRS
ncbi:MAG: LPS export ABC transporter permease LptF [Acetobacteraceae bacterium]